MCFMFTLRRLELPGSFENVSFVLACSFLPKNADWLECEMSSIILLPLITVVRVVILNMNENYSYIGRQSLVKLLVRTHTCRRHIRKKIIMLLLAFVVVESDGLSQQWEKTDNNESSGQQLIEESVTCSSVPSAQWLTSFDAEARYSAAVISINQSVL